MRCGRRRARAASGSGQEATSSVSAPEVPLRRMCHFWGGHGTCEVLPHTAPMETDMRLTLTLATLAAGLFAVGLVACGSGADEHDHGTHGSGDDGGHDEHHASGDSAPMADLKKIEPSADYPLTTCVVSGEELGSMGDPLAYEYDGQEIQLCCAGCVDDFKKSPAEYVAKVREADRR